MTLLKQVVSVDVTQTALKGPAAAQGRSAAAEDTTVRIIYEAEVARDLRWTPSNNGGGYQQRRRRGPGHPQSG